MSDVKILELDGVEVRHGSVAAVRKLDLHVHEGEIVGLIGPNGAGKSTTLYAIMGVLAPRAGEIRLKGRRLRSGRPEDVARAGIALVPEGRRIFGDFSVEENLRLGLSGRRGGDGGSALDAVYELFPILADARGRQAGALSGGQQQQLAIGRALVASPDVLLLDEPARLLAPRIVDVGFDALAASRGRGVGV
ncbi:MAG: ATP-binding cassette domain-containing protein, partial [Gaiellaceae bacterium]